MPKTVVILLSDKRSGSTMFQDALCRHSMIQTVDYSPHTYLETHHWLKGTVLLDRPAKRDPGGAVYGGYGSKANARTYMEDLLVGNLAFGEDERRETRDEGGGGQKAESGKKKAENGKRKTENVDLRAEVGRKTAHRSPLTASQINRLSDHDLIFDGWEALCQRFAQPVFFEKSPQYLGFPASLDLIEEWTKQTKFNVKFIGLTRNPLSVQYSAWKLFHRVPNDRQYGWAELQQEMLDFEQRLEPGQLLHVNYENLIGQPDAEFEKICTFIGVPYDRSITQKVHGKSLEKWKDDPYFTLRLDDSVKALAKEFGYTDEELDNPEKPEPPLSWKLRKKAEATYKIGKAHLKDRVLKPIFLKARGGRR